MMLMLCLAAQQVFALRFRVRVPAGESGESSGAVKWIVYAIVAVVVAVTLYRYFFKARGLLRLFKGGFRMDENTSLTEDQQRKILLGAIYAMFDKGYLNSVKTGLEKEEREDRLKEDWNIDDHNTAVDALNDLKIA